MISIIICSRKKSIPTNLAENIAATIGCEYEMINIDNSENSFSIFEAYNLGIEKSSGEFLCFMHDDILIHTNGWGNTVTNIFENEKNAALLGVAGAKIKSSMPSGWWNVPKELKEINIIQHKENQKTEKWDFGFKSGTISEVAAIDGVFMVLRKNAGLSFNTALKGFHNYDLNISIVCKMKGFKILVTNQILLEHFSNGNINDSWYESTLKLHEIYKKALPLIASDFNNTVLLKHIEISNGKKIAGQLFGIGKKKEAVRIWKQLILIQPFSLFHLKFFKRIITK